MGGESNSACIFKKIYTYYGKDEKQDFSEVSTSLMNTNDPLPSHSKGMAVYPTCDFDFSFCSGEKTYHLPSHQKLLSWLNATSYSAVFRAGLRVAYRQESGYAYCI